MPKLKPDTQRARREHILDAAMRCFARGGFHATTMQDICREAAVSPGALYVYFNSKESLIEGLCERDRSEFAERFADLATAPDFLAALSAIGEHYFIEDSPDKPRFVMEMGLEATRNPRIADIFMSVDRHCLQSFETLFERLKSEGRIAPNLPVPVLARVFSLLGDGMFFRRAIEPGFDMREVLPAIIDVVARMVNPVEPQLPNSSVQRRSGRASEITS